ncbi:hypothetical protein [Trichodesmium erythraeum]|uniref:hypothetical protein n=1 Tax=Trichodesmium erythraeum TaxID=1206 RepID=UPI00351B82E9
MKDLRLENTYKLTTQIITENQTLVVEDLLTYLAVKTWLKAITHPEQEGWAVMLIGES